MQDRNHVEDNKKNPNADKNLKQKSPLPGDKTRIEGEAERQPSTERQGNRK